MQPRSGAEYRRQHQSISGNLVVAAADGDATLVTCKGAAYTIWIQKIIAYITTDAAQSWAFTDSNGTPKAIAKVTTSPGVDTRWEFDFGDVGVPCTEGKNFLLDVSAAGLAGHIEWLGYQRESSTMTAAAFAL